MLSRLPRLNQPAAFLIVIIAMIAKAAIADELYISEYTAHDVFRYSLAGVALGKFTTLPTRNDADDMAFDTAGNLFVSDWSSAVYKVDPSGNANSFAAVPSLAGIAFDTTGNLYAASWKNDVVRFAANGASLGNFATTGLNAPTFMTFGPDGDLYVGNFNGNTIRRFSSSGQDLGDFATGLNTPTGIAFGTDGNLYVAERGANDIRKFSSGGADLGVFASGGLTTTGAIKFGPDGNLYVTDFSGGDIHRYSASGADLGVFISGLSQPQGLAFGPDAGVPENGTLPIAAIGLILVGLLVYKKRSEVATGSGV